MSLDKVGEQVNKGKADFAFFAVSSFVLTSLFSVLFLADREDIFAPAAIGGHFFPLQIVLFILFFAGHIIASNKLKNSNFWPYTACTSSIYILVLSLHSTSATLSLGLTVLHFVLLWSVCKDRLPAFCPALLLALSFLITLIFTILQLYRQKEVLLKQYPNFARLGLRLLSLFILSLILALFLEEAKRYRQKKLLQANRPHPLVNKLPLLLAVALILFALYLALYLMGKVMLHRIWSFSTPTFDFGLFNQMFEYMKETGRPLTTLERDGLYSHFHVHFSPIYYLLLPFYLLFPKPETLQILQLIIVTSGIVPLYLLCRKCSLSTVQSALLGAIYLLQPGILLSSFYDLHENCFLAPLVLWIFYAMFTRKPVLLAFSSFLLLLVKEDAALYLVSAALFLFFSPYFSSPYSADRRTNKGSLEKKEKNKLYCKDFFALTLILFAVIFFFLVFRYINIEGDGIMTYRFASLIQYETDGILGIIRSIFQNPANLLALIFHDNKLEYLIIFSLGTGFLPFFQKHKSSYLLFLPLLVMNLATNYRYQYHIMFQYGYGSHTFLVLALLLTLLSAKENQIPQDLVTTGGRRRIKTCVRPFLASFLVCLAFLSSSFISYDYIKGNRVYQETFEGNQAYYLELRKELDALPRDKSIATNTFFTTVLADVPELYDFEYNASIREGRQVDLLVLNRQHPRESEKEIASIFLHRGYRYSEQYSSDYLYVLEFNESAPKAPGKSSTMD